MGENPTTIAPTAVPAQFIKLPFEQAHPELAIIVERRRGAWAYLSIMDWQEVSHLLMVRLWSKYHLYDPSRANKAARNPLENWANRVITHALLNMRRDIGLQRFSRPCIGGGKANGKMCEYNRGADLCAYTTSKVQCAECPLYAEWQKVRQHQLHIKSTVALENHSQEVNNIQSDFVDTDEIKEWLDQEMLKELTRWEGRVYRLLFVDHLSPTDSSVKLIAAAKKRKLPLSAEDQTSYQAVLVYRKRFTEMMKEILVRAGHINPPKKQQS